MTAIEIKSDLAKQEEIIERGLATFIEVGRALMAIRDRELYKDKYLTFKDYCQVRWGMTRQHAYRLIDAADVANDVSPIGDIAHESQARPLKQFDTDMRRVAWQLAAETAPNGKVTSGHVQSIVNVLQNAIQTGALDPGDGEQLPLSQALHAAITEETYERMMRQKTHIAEKQQSSPRPKPTTLIAPLSFALLSVLEDELQALFEFPDTDEGREAIRKLKWLYDHLDHEKLARLSVIELSSDDPFSRPPDIVGMAQGRDTKPAERA